MVVLLKNQDKKITMALPKKPRYEAEFKIQLSSLPKIIAKANNKLDNPQIEFGSNSHQLASFDAIHYHKS